ncbi:MAG: CoA pyrophosphatase [Desulfuromonadales bacterium]|nr:CoA pyrophosphatase [Desulfuromonadales bacterium]
MSEYDNISAALNRKNPELIISPGYSHAAVAMIIHIKEDEKEPSILFIERALHPKDPWSGNIGFPGGRVEQGDTDYNQTAIRETEEELGFNLNSAKYLGRLSDVGGSHLAIAVSCFVYGIEGKIPEFKINKREVQDIFWLPVNYILNPKHCSTHKFHFADENLESPCIKLPMSDKPVLWGLTYKLVMDFIRTIQ